MADEEQIAKSAAGCADCGATRPRFASITLGIWLCNRCYGLHRNVGVHVTRTKCVGLDKWSSQELHRMRSIGNERAAAFWERNVPADYIRPTAESSNEVVDKWIRDKYDRKLFCPTDCAPPSVAEQAVNSNSFDGHRRPGGSKSVTVHKGKFPYPVASASVPLIQSSTDIDDDDEFGSFVQAPS